MPTERARLVCLGVITGSRGLRGDVRIKSFTEDPAAIGAYGPLRDKSGERTFDLRIVGPVKGVIIARIEGIDDRDAAEALKGTELYVERDALPEPEADEFYHRDLIGLRVERKEGGVVGTVSGVEDYGAGPLLEITAAPDAPEAADLDPVFLVPFTREAVPEVDIKGGRVVIDPPPGILTAAEDDDGEEGEERD